MSEVNGEISQDRPACVVLLIDQSGSMGSRFRKDRTSESRATVVCESLEQVVRRLIGLSMPHGTLCLLNDCFDIGVLGYKAVPSPLLNDWIQPISALISAAIPGPGATAIPSGQGASDPYRLLWYKPHASGNDANIAGAFAEAYRILTAWVARHPDSHPPIVINITDGNPATWPTAEGLREFSVLQNGAGQAPFIFNCLLADDEEPSQIFPARLSRSADQYSQLLFEGSSVLSPGMARHAGAILPGLGTGSRGFVLNPSVQELNCFLSICTSTLDHVRCDEPSARQKDTRAHRIPKPPTTDERSFSDVFSDVATMPESDQQAWLNTIEYDRVTPSSLIEGQRWPDGTAHTLLQSDPRGPCMIREECGRFLLYPLFLLERESLISLAGCFSWELPGDSADGQFQLLSVETPAVCELRGEGFTVIEKGRIKLGPCIPLSKELPLRESAVSDTDDGAQATDRPARRRTTRTVILGSAALISLFLLVFTQILPEFQYRRSLKRAEGLIEKNPDEALVKIDALQRQRDSQDLQSLRERALSALRLKRGSDYLIAAEECAKRNDFIGAESKFAELRNREYKGVPFPTVLANKENEVRSAASAFYRRKAEQELDPGLAFAYYDSALSYSGDESLRSTIDSFLAGAREAIYSSLLRRASDDRDCANARRLVDLCLKAKPSEITALKLREVIQQRCSRHR